MKTCRKCKIEQPLNNFLVDKRTNKPTSRCDACRREAQRDNYRRARPHIKAWIYDYLSRNPCVDCGETDPLRLEFDHRGDKHFDIGKSFIGKAKGIEIVQSEIAKCDVRCANCHRVKTHQEKNTWKYQLSIERSTT